MDRAPVSFVGAGPGAPDLITVRGDRALREADVVVWAGSLVNPALLDVCKPSCAVWDSSHLTLDRIVDIMVTGWSEGKRVVRLHTGDPSIFGAVREQMDALTQAGVPFEIVPGVSSMCGAAAALECEYTLPGISQAVIVARAQGRTAVPAGQDLASLAQHGATMVVFLSAGLAQQVQDDVISAGTDPATPAAIVYKATWPDERVARCTVGTLAQTAATQGIDRTALIVIGRVLEPQGGAARYEKSRLYDPSFSTGFREAQAAKHSKETS